MCRGILQVNIIPDGTSCKEDDIQTKKITNKNIYGDDIEVVCVIHTFQIDNNIDTVKTKHKYVSIAGIKCDQILIPPPSPLVWTILAKKKSDSIHCNLVNIRWPMPQI